MSSCLSGGGRTAYVIDLDIIKSSPSSSFRTSHSSSPSSTLSESSNSPITISTRKPRTPRKRPNQTYNEAAALLSTAYPNIFSTKPCKFIKPHHCSSFSFEDELLLPFPAEKPLFHTAYAKPYSAMDAEEIGCQMNSCDNFDDFDTESILDEEIEEGVIDSIMGDLSVCPKDKEESPITCSNGVAIPVNFCYGYPMGFGFGLGFEFGYGMMRGGGGGGVASAFRQNHGDWWRYPTVDMGEISPAFKVSAEKKKKVEKMNPKLPHSLSIKHNSISSKSSLDENSNPAKSSSTSNKENPVPVTKSSTEKFLKLNYDEVLNAWSDRGSPFSEDTPASEFSGTDALARLAQIDLFGENGGLREASVQRYKEKRRTRLFSKKIRYQVRKVNADQRPRMKGAWQKEKRLLTKLNKAVKGSISVLCASLTTSI